MTAEQPWQMKMTVPLEFGISVINMDLMIKFFTEILGLKIVGDNSVPAELSARTGATPHGYRIVRLQTPYGERIKLAQAGLPPKQGEGVSHVMARQGLAYLTFVIEDLDGMIKRLKDHGVRLLSGGEKVEVRQGVYAIYSIDPEGNFIEFVEYPDVASYRPDLYK